MRFRTRTFLLLVVFACSVLLLLKCHRSAFPPFSSYDGCEMSDKLIRMRTEGIPMLGINLIELTRRDKHTLAEQLSSDRETPLYTDYAPKHTRHVTLVDDTRAYFINSGECLREGTKAISTESCFCKDGWHGTACSIPDIVVEEQFVDRTKFRVRKAVPRRLVYAMTFNMEFEMLELRFAEVGDLIDVLLLVESNYTGFGKPKPLYLLDKLKRGFLKPYQHKIVHLLVDYFPTSTEPTDGKYTDYYLKDYAGVRGLQYVHGLRDDDIFLFADADELHRREALLFLKLHDGYPEPVGAHLRNNVFGFFWTSGISILGIACSVHMLRTVYKNNFSPVRDAERSSEELYVSRLKDYKDSGHNVQMWRMGSKSLVAGWHCSWCFDAERVRIKLLSAFNYDFPRWGDFSEKTNLNYIRTLIQLGVWFDDVSLFQPQFVGCHYPYAPAYALRHSEKYFDILFNPFWPL